MRKVKIGNVVYEIAETPDMAEMLFGMEGRKIEEVAIDMENNRIVVVQFLLDNGKRVSISSAGTDEDGCDISECTWIEVQ